MKTTIGELRKAMKQAMKAVNKGVCSIKAENGSLTIIASSIEGAIMIAVPVEGQIEDCNAVLSQKQIMAIFNGASDSASCQIKNVPGGVSLSFGGVRIKLLHPYEGDAESLLATAANAARKKAFTCTGGQLAKALKGPVNYAAKSDVRVYLTGTYFEAEDGVLRVTATDGIKLCTVKSEIATAEMSNFILPISTSQAIHAVFDSDDEFTVWQIGGDSNMTILLSNERVRWIATLVTGTYPKWRNVLPKDHRHAQVIVNCDALVCAVNRVMAVSDSMYVALLFSEKGVTVQSIDKEQSEILAFDKTLVSEENRFALNGKLLVDAVSCIDTTDIDIYLDGDNFPNNKIVFKPFDGENTVGNWIGFMMPTKV